MLERATACLDSGARLSVRCARRASRSNRSLSSTFWNHGASDLELSPWAASHASQPPLDVHGSTQQSGRVSKKEQDKRAASTPIESPFLDFLYPPQALALLQRNGNNRVERWERRNERRLPKGFVQANRRYSSKAETHIPTAETTNSNDNVEDDWQHDDSDFGSGGSQVHAGDAAQQVDGTMNRGVGSAQWEPLEHDDESKDSTSSDSPTELAADAAIAESIHCAKTLRSLIDVPGEGVAFEPKKSLEYTEFAWSLFEKSKLRDRPDVSLQIKLLEWMSYHRNETAETHCLELYHAIPSARRTLEVYMAALPAFIRSNLYGLAEEAHAEALDQLEKGHNVSVLLCSTAIEHEMWDLASRVKQQLDDKRGGRTDDPWEAIFWQKIAETPDLLSKAINMSKHGRMLSQAYALTNEFESFSTDMYKVAIVQQFTNSYLKREVKNGLKPLSRAEKTLNDGRVRYLIGRIQHTSADAPVILRDLITSLTQRSSKVPYHDAHNTVSYLYQQLCSMRYANFRPYFLSQLMKRVVDYMDSPSAKWQKPWHISPLKVEEAWVKQHGKMDLWMHHWLMEYYAATGNVEQVQYAYEGLQIDYPDYSDHEEVLWTLVYVHARRGEAKQAASAFETVQALATAAGDTPSLRIWNVLLHAHSRADDIDGGLAVFKKLIDSGCKPDKYSFHPVLELYASRGDVDSVKDLLEQFDSLSGDPHSTELYGSLMTAHIKAYDVNSAYKVLEELIPKVRTGEVQGDLTKCFNILLTGLALGREIDETRQVYRWMKEEDVNPDSMTYAALMQALVAYRQPAAAWDIIKRALPEKGLEAQAFHYAIVMTGFLKIHSYTTVLSIHKRMLSRGIKPTLSTDAIYLKAKALYETNSGPRGIKDANRYPVEQIVDELREIFRDPAAGLASPEPQHYSPLEDDSPQTLLFNHLIFVYGAAKSMKAVQTLVKMFEEERRKDEDYVSGEPLPLRLLTIVMPSYIQARNWEEVDRCWDLAKEQADAKSINKPVPWIGTERDPESATDILELSVEQTTRNPRSLLAESKSEDPSRPAPALRHILSQPLRSYIMALGMQARFSEMISTVANLLGRGYTLDNSTWNIFIEHLVRPSPPLALLAFRLTERYLIPSFPGWVRGRVTYKYSQKAQGLEYIRAAYLRPDQLMPRYKTLVKLAAAVLEIRRLETLGLLTNKKDKGAEGDNLDRYVGTIKQLRQQAPRTLYAIQSMPAVEDRLQTTYLRREQTQT